MAQASLKADGSQLLFPVWALALALMPVSVCAQTRTSARDEVVWHWLGACATSDSLALELHFDGKPLHSSVFSICQVRRTEIKPEPQQRVLQFRFDGDPRRFRSENRATGTQPIEGNIWDAGGERDAILLGVSFSTQQQVLLNTIHVARARSPSRSERIRGLVITTRPVHRSERTPPNMRLKLPGAHK